MSEETYLDETTCAQTQSCQSQRFDFHFKKEQDEENIVVVTMTISIDMKNNQPIKNRGNSKLKFDKPIFVPASHERQVVQQPKLTTTRFIIYRNSSWKTWQTYIKREWWKERNEISTKTWQTHRTENFIHQSISHETRDLHPRTIIKRIHTYTHRKLIRSKVKQP